MLSSHSYSHESVIYFYFFDKYLLSYGEFAFFQFKCMRLRTLLQPLKTTLRVSPSYYDREQQVVHSGLSYWV